MIEILTNKLVNPTPFDVQIDWDKGVVIPIPGDAQVDLTMAQMDDFRPGKPGSEEARHLLEYNGLFLLDGDRSWDEQALEAIEKALKEKKSQFDAFVGRIRDSRIASGSPVDDDAMSEIVERAGYGKIEAQCQTLSQRAQVLKDLLRGSDTAGKVKERTLDPKRTCFITKPPREFPSETALKLFLMEQSKEFQEQHAEYTKSLFEEEGE